MGGGVVSQKDWFGNLSQPMILNSHFFATFCQQVLNSRGLNYVSSEKQLSNVWNSAKTGDHGLKRVNYIQHL